MSRFFQVLQAKIYIHQLIWIVCAFSASLATFDTFFAVLPHTRRRSHVTVSRSLGSRLLISLVTRTRGDLHRYGDLWGHYVLSG